MNIRKKQSIFQRLRTQSLAAIAVLSVPPRNPAEAPPFENLPPEKHRRPTPKEEPYAQTPNKTDRVRVYDILEDLADNKPRMVGYRTPPEQGEQ